MRITRFISLFILALSMVAILAPVSVSASPAMPTEGPAFQGQATPTIPASAALAIDLTNGLQLFNQDGDARVAPASTMKLVTVLVAMTVLSPDEQLTIVEQDLYLGEDFSQMGLLAGDVVTVETLLYGAMLSSGADASLALARVAGQRLDPGAADPVQRFVDEMNAWAAANEMYGSHFTNPVGTDEEGHYVTARDLVRVIERVLDDWLIRQVFTTPEITLSVGGPNARDMYLFSTNEFVLSGEAIGGKTGTEDLARQCLVNVTMRGNHTIVTVIMGSEDRYADTYTLLDHVSQRFRFVTLGAGTDVPGVAEDMATRGLTFPVHHTVVMTPAQVDALGYTLELTGQSTPGGKAGTVIFTTGGREVLRLPVHTTG